MSDKYRVYDDRWRLDPSIHDRPVDVSHEFRATEAIMDEISNMLAVHREWHDDMENVVLESMVQAVFGSNKLSHVDLGFDETLKICIAVFKGEKDVEFTDRYALSFVTVSGGMALIDVFSTDEYQAKLTALARQGVRAGEKQVLRSRREVVQHAAAFQHIISAFVNNDQPLDEMLIKETHEILMRGVSGEDAGVLSAKEFGGTYRKSGELAFGGTTEFTKPSGIPAAMRSLVQNFEMDVAAIERHREIDPWVLAATYCDRFVNIHPFKDGNGRMCRLILTVCRAGFTGETI